MNQSLLFSILMGVIVVFAIFRRVRRNIGRQPVQPTAMQFRIALLALVAVLIAVPALRDMLLIGAFGAGIVAGAALGWFGLRHTKFERTAEGSFYTPHTYIGLALSALLIGRIAYRLLTVYPPLNAASQGTGQVPLAALQTSPLTLAIFGVLIGYYTLYYAGVLRVSKNAPAAA
jgi:hypothetical protein